MWEKVSIVRTPKGLKEAKAEIAAMLESRVGRLLKLRLLTAQSIVNAALARRTSVGVHFINNEEEI